MTHALRSSPVGRNATPAQTFLSSVLGAPRLAGMLYCGSRTQGPCGLRSIPLLNFIPLNSLLAWNEPGLPAAPLTRSFHLFLCLC